MSAFTIERIAFLLGNRDHAKRAALAEARLVTDEARHRVFLAADGTVCFPSALADQRLQREGAVTFRRLALAQLAATWTARTEAEGAP